MSQFATVAQLEDRIGETIGTSGQEFDTATQLLQHATALIQNYTGQTFDAASVATETFDAPGTAPLFLPLLPVTGVASVVQDDMTLVESTDYDWYESGIIRLRKGASNNADWGTTPKSIVVTYSHGYAVSGNITAVPDDVKTVCLEVVARAVLGRPIMHRATGTADSEGNPIVLPIPAFANLTLAEEDESVLDSYRLVAVG